MTIYNKHGFEVTEMNGGEYYALADSGMLIKNFKTKAGAMRALERQLKQAGH